MDQNGADRNLRRANWFIGELENGLLKSLNSTKMGFGWFDRRMAFNILRRTFIKSKNDRLIFLKIMYVFENQTYHMANP